jgi:hypothetical protein
MSEVFEQVPEASCRRILVRRRDLREFSWVGLRPEVVNDLRRTVEAGRVMEVTASRSKSSIPCHLRKSGLGSQPTEPSVPIGLGEHIRSLVDEVDALGPITMGRNCFGTMT